ncbi:ABC transporter permease [Paenibacillus lutimineralis]|uniref:ABC transporter permease n=1 Tax=Paenibacillus lutimineralis TaxID=2707005 RepID=A0A3S9UV68_9BACL|nr:ABC transporter permease [Paenibacillus lutimineralis]AZS14186.1 ABC transporter permease [Paenibacillus lutimineralis]
MTFRDVTIKNFKRNVRNFFSYFICSAFAITIFFLYAALLFNTSVREAATEDVIKIVLMLSLAALTLFSVFFINYAHSSFIKSRSKEFAIFMSLGMHKNDLQKIILLENLIISVSSMIVGILTGSIFSRLFQNVAINLLDLQGVSYSLSAASFIVTAVVFTVIFAVSQMISSVKVGKLEIADLMKDSRKTDNKAKKHAGKLGLLGVVLVLASFVLLVIISNHESLNTNPFMIITYILMSFIGIYMVISHLGNTLIGFLKNKKFYYHHILSITEINHKFNQNKRIMFILSILSGMTIFLVASPFSLLQLSESIAERNKHDIEFVSVAGVHAIPANELEGLLKQAPDPLKNIKETSFLNLKMNLEGSKYDILKTKPIVSQDMYNALTGENVQVGAGEALNIITAWEPGSHGIEQGVDIEFTDGQQTFNYKIASSYHGDWFASAGSYPTSSGIVVSNQDYADMQVKVNSAAVGTHYGIDFESWKGTDDVVLMLKDTLNAMDKDGSGQLFQVASKVDAYKELKKNYSLFVFVTTLIGVLFFVAGGMVLYFKQYTEMGNATVFFRKLHKIGISDKEIRGVVSAELLITFFVPLLLGSVFGYCFIYLITHVMSGSDIIGEFMTNTTIVVAIYFVFQLSFYLITKRKYSREVVRKLTSAA